VGFFSHHLFQAQHFIILSLLLSLLFLLHFNHLLFLSHFFLLRHLHLLLLLRYHLYNFCIGKVLVYVETESNLQILLHPTKRKI
jgi:hypothetical protein